MEPVYIFTGRGADSEPVNAWVAGGGSEPVNVLGAEVAGGGMEPVNVGIEGGGNGPVNALVTGGETEPVNADAGAGVAGGGIKPVNTGGAWVMAGEVARDPVNVCFGGDVFVGWLAMTVAMVGD